MPVEVTTDDDLTNVVFTTPQSVEVAITDPAVIEVTITNSPPGSGGSGTPVGPDGAVQYNSSGSLAGDDGLTYEDGVLNVQGHAGYPVRLAEGGSNIAWKNPGSTVSARLNQRDNTEVVWSVNVDDLDATDDSTLPAVKMAMWPDGNQMTFQNSPSGNDGWNGGSNALIDLETGEWQFVHRTQFDDGLQVGTAYAASGGASVDLDDSLLRDSTSQTSVDWQNRQLRNTDGEVTLDWNTPMAGGNVRPYEVYLEVDYPIDTAQPYNDINLSTGNRVLVQWPSNGERGIYRVDDNGIDQHLILETALFDGSHDGSVIWAYHRVSEAANAWDITGPYTYGVYTTDSCSLVPLAGPGLARSGSGFMPEVDSTGEIPSDSRLVYVGDNTNTQVILPDSCSQEGTSFYLTWNPAPASEVTFISNYADPAVTWMTPAPWGVGSVVFLQFIPDPYSSGWNVWWLNAPSDVVSVDGQTGVVDLSEVYDALGAADSAQTAAEAYTDTQIAGLPAAPVASVNGQVGVVSLSASDVGADASGAADAAEAFAVQRSNHTGTQLLATISDAGTAASHAATDFVPSSYLDSDGTLAANSDVKVATQKAVRTLLAAAIADLINSAPGTLDTLGEIAAALAADETTAAALATTVAGKMAKAANLSDVANAATARTNLGVAIGSDVQAHDADLDAVAALTTDAFGLALLTKTTSSAVRSYIGLVIGTDVQAYSANLAALAGLTSAADKGIQFTGAGTAATFDLTTAGKALLDDADASAQRTTLGLGTSAVVDVPASGNATSLQVVKGSDTRLTDSRTPSVHAATHASGGSDPVTLAESQITGLVSDLAAKAPITNGLRVIPASRVATGSTIATLLVPINPSGTTQVVANGTMVLAPANGASQTIATLYVIVSATSLTGTQTIEVSLYTDPDGLPGTQTWKQNLTVGTSTGNITVGSLSLAIPSAPYWLGVMNPSGNAGSVTLRCGNLLPIAGRQTITMGNGNWGPGLSVTGLASSPADLSGYQIRSGTTTGVLNADQGTFPVVGAVR